MKEYEIDFFLFSLKYGDTLKGCIRGDIEKKICELACEGCGDGEKCTKSPDSSPCIDCLSCGCPKCEMSYDIYDGFIDYPPYQYDKRKKLLEKKVTETMKKSAISLERFMPYLSNKFIERNFPWEHNKDIWRRFVFNPNTKCMWQGTAEQYNELSEDDKQMFVNPDEAYPLLFNNNILRIMSGLSGLCYTN
jgi:hypothetical protein